MGPDLLTVLAVLALAGVVYLCSLPSTFQSLSHRQAGAAALMGQARERIVKEGSLFAALVRSTDEHEAARLRRQLVDNERGFHEAASDVAAELPEAKLDIDAMVSRFDNLAAAGWQAAAAASHTPPEARPALLEGAFARALDELRDESQRMELGLHAHDTVYRVELPVPRRGVVVSI